MAIGRKEQVSKEECDKRILFAKEKEAEWCRIFNEITDCKFPYPGSLDDMDGGIKIQAFSYCVKASSDVKKISEDCSKKGFFKK